MSIEENESQKHATPYGRGITHNDAVFVYYRSMNCSFVKDIGWRGISASH